MNRGKYRFDEIIGQIKELVEEAIDLVPEGERRSRAEAYWYSAIITNLDDNHGFMGGSMHSMADTFEELEFNGDDDDDIYDDDDDFEMDF